MAAAGRWRPAVALAAALLASPGGGRGPRAQLLAAAGHLEGSAELQPRQWTLLDATGVAPGQGTVELKVDFESDSGADGAANELALLLVPDNQWPFWGYGPIGPQPCTGGSDNDFAAHVTPRLLEGTGNLKSITTNLVNKQRHYTWFVALGTCTVTGDHKLAFRWHLTTKNSGAEGSSDVRFARGLTVALGLVSLCMLHWPTIEGQVVVSVTAALAAAIDILGAVCNLVHLSSMEADGHPQLEFLRGAVVADALAYALLAATASSLALRNNRQDSDAKPAAVALGALVFFVLTLLLEWSAMTGPRCYLERLRVDEPLGTWAMCCALLYWLGITFSAANQLRKNKKDRRAFNTGQLRAWQSATLSILGRHVLRLACGLAHIHVRPHIGCLARVALTAITYASLTRGPGTSLLRQLCDLLVWGIVRPWVRGILRVADGSGEACGCLGYVRCLFTCGVMGSAATVLAGGFSMFSWTGNQLRGHATSVQDHSAGHRQELHGGKKRHYEHSVTTAPPLRDKGLAARLDQLEKAVLTRLDHSEKVTLDAVEEAQRKSTDAFNQVMTNTAGPQRGSGAEGFGVTTESWKQLDLDAKLPDAEALRKGYGMPQDLVRAMLIRTSQKLEEVIRPYITEGSEGRPEVSILYPNSFMGQVLYSQDTTFEPCPVKCTWHNHRSRLSTATAVVYHLVNGGVLPKRGFPGQRWLGHQIEPDSHSRSIREPRILQQLNATMSTIIGGHNPEAAANGVDLHIHTPLWSDYWFEDPIFWRPLPSPAANPRKPYLAFLQNGCSEVTKRTEYVKALMAHIQVDSYGSCLRNKHDSRAMRDTNSLLKGYMFYLTLEPYELYLSDKVYRGLQAGAIPVFRGHPRFREFLPQPDAVINADDFAGPKALAAYLKRVAAEPSLWFKHVAWRFQPKGISEPFVRAARFQYIHSQCRVCIWALTGRDPFHEREGWDKPLEPHEADGEWGSPMSMWNKHPPPKEEEKKKKKKEGAPGTCWAEHKDATLPGAISGRNYPQLHLRVAKEECISLGKDCAGVGSFKVGLYTFWRLLHESDQRSAPGSVLYLKEACKEDQ